jgi:hypothetical protein
MPYAPKIVAGVCLFLMFTALHAAEGTMTDTSTKKADAATGLYKAYKVRRAARPIPVDADWDKPAWRGIEPAAIGLHMGERPEHFPAAQFRMAYDAENLYLIFRVEDRYVRAVATADGGRVWEDSCAEFFFTPDADVAAGYFNFETNCIGARYWHHHGAGKAEEAIGADDLAKVTLAHSLPEKKIEPEITTPLTWTVEYRVPIEIISRYAKVKQPGPGVRWRANFYKCGDKTSHPHFLTWSRIDYPTPKFHLPEFFGTLEFE